MIKFAFHISCLIILFSSCSNNVSKNPSLNLNKDSLAAVNLEKEDSAFLFKYPLITWVRKSPVEIGCMLQSEFSFKDSVFNCDYKNYVNKGDPCKNTTAYYEGIVFPAKLVTKVNPLVNAIDLDFEHGSLREITITFKDSLLKDKIKQLFNLPSERNKFPDNVMDISYGENIGSKDKPIDPKYTKWLTITGFDHIGAGDAECD